MKERPILFNSENSEMVRAILDDRKTQTRRMLKTDHYCIGERDDGTLWPWREDCKSGGDIWYSCPMGSVGDRLWVREAFQCGLCTKSSFAYRATHNPSDLEEGWEVPIKWHPSIHMPRWASRITLQITGVRVERLLDISEEDAKAEGFPGGRRHFMDTWIGMHGRTSWDANPWVWVIEFKRLEKQL